MTAMIDAAITGNLDAITFTSAPAVASMLGHADKLGLLEQFLTALRFTTPALCVGPVTAGPLQAIGVPTLQPFPARRAGPAGGRGAAPARATPAGLRA
jgi:uroporphyrinogen-III synthase